MKLDDLSLLLPAVFTLVTACAAFSLRHVVHGVLLLTASWVGLAAYYLWAGVEFIAFAQVLVYVGAISMVVLFAVLLTRRGGDPAEAPASRSATVRRALLGVSTALLTAIVLGSAVLATPLPEFPEIAKTATEAGAAPTAPSAIKAIGTALVSTHAAALLITGVLLTVALLGAVHLAATDKDGDTRSPGR